MITLKAEFHPDYYQLTWGLIHFRIPMKAHLKVPS